MLNYISIRSKILILLLFVGLMTSFCIGLLAYRAAHEALTTSIYEELTAVRDSKMHEANLYFSDQVKVFEILSTQKQIADAIDGFREGFSHKYQPVPNGSIVKLRSYYLDEYLPRLNKNSIGEPQLETYFPSGRVSQTLQIQFIAENEAPLGEKANLLSPNEVGNMAEASDVYSRIHTKHHSFFKRMQHRLEYYDIFLIDHITGDIVYSVGKETDFATNLETGPYRFSNLAKAYRRVKENPSLGNVVLVDYAHYAPSYNNPSAFLAAPIYDGKILKGIVAAQLDTVALDDFMTSSGRWKEHGLGDTGEVYLVGADKLLRSSSRFLIEDKEAYLKSLDGTAMPQKCP